MDTTAFVALAFPMILPLGPSILKTWDCLLYLDPYILNHLLYNYNLFYVAFTSKKYIDYEHYA